MNDAFRVLFVCTGNICRSPAAERLLRASLPADARVLTTSAGTHALEGLPTDPPTAYALLRRRIDPGGHEARPLTASLIAEADLVLGATRAHRAAVVSMNPRAVRYTFTIREFARLAGYVVDQPDFVPQGADLLIAEVRAMRGIIRVADPADDDIVDPFGRNDAAAVAAVVAIATETEVISRVLSVVTADTDTDSALGDRSAPT